MWQVDLCFLGWLQACLPTPMGSAPDGLQGSIGSGDGGGGVGEGSGDGSGEFGGASGGGSGDGDGSGGGPGDSGGVSGGGSGEGDGFSVPSVGGAGDSGSGGVAGGSAPSAGGTGDSSSGSCSSSGELLSGEGPAGPVRPQLVAQSQNHTNLKIIDSRAQIMVRQHCSRHTTAWVTQKQQQQHSQSRTLASHIG